MRGSALAAAVVVAAGCAGRGSFFVAADFRAREPGSVAVLPFDNETVSLRGPELVRALVAERLKGLGYRSLPLAEIDEKLRAIGVTDGGQLRAYEPKEIGRALGSEGLFYGTLEEFVHQNVGFLRRRAVRVRLSLVEAGTGERLWEGVGVSGRARVALKKEKAGKAFLEGVVEDAAEGALRVPLLPEARKAVWKLFRGYPR